MRLKHQSVCFIGGQWVPALSHDVINDLNPATGEVFATAAWGRAEDINLAVTRAQNSFDERLWLGMDPLERARTLGRLGQRLRDCRDELGQLMVEENGMPTNFAQWLEIPMAADVFDYFASLIPVTGGRTLPFSLPGPQGDYWLMTFKEPVGVAGVITPWNFPLLMPAWKIAPALAAGCSVVLKPAPETPLTALALADLAQQAGIPDGVLNVVPGGDETGRSLVCHPNVPKIAFTGQTQTGKQVMADAAPFLKRVTLELGGKSPQIVFDDVNLDEVVAGALFGVYLYSGQVCQAGSRILVQETLYPQFLDYLKTRAEALALGNGADVGTDLGPLISSTQQGRVLSYIQQGIDAGAALITGGKALDRPGFFIEPTVFGEVKPSMAIAQEEIFGPVLSVIPFHDEDEAIRLANGTPYGLAAGIWTRDIKRAMRVTGQIRAGTIWLNTYQILSPTAPFGGYKYSGIGRELGPDALEAYLETKTVIVDGNEQAWSFF